MFRRKPKEYRIRRKWEPFDRESYQETMEQYDAEEEELKKYREQCKDEAFALFAKWFYHLWD